MLDFATIIPQIPFIIGGVWVTLKFTIVSLLCGMPLGFLLGVFSISRRVAIKRFAAVYVSIFRGTPLLVQLFLIYNAIPPLTGYAVSAFEAAVLTFSLNSAAYTSQSIRAGIQSIDVGQWDAAQILGLSRYQTLKTIIMPQALRNIFPALLNEMVNLLKESALISAIGGGGDLDLMRRAQAVAAQHYIAFEPYLVVAACYFVMVLVITKIADRVEKKLSY